MELINWIPEFIHWFIDIVLHLDAHLVELLRDYGFWVYLILFVIVFCETGLVVTPFLPGDSLLFAAGALASKGAFDVNLLAVLLLVAAIVGDAANYTVGRYIGPKVFERKNSRIFKPEYLRRTQAFYDKYGAKTI